MNGPYDGQLTKGDKPTNNVADRSRDAIGPPFNAEMSIFINVLGGLVRLRDHPIHIVVVK